MPSVEIAGHKVGQGHPCFIVAEIGANHLQDINVTCQLIEAAKEAGADAVKIQVYKPASMTIDRQRPEFEVNEDVYKGSLWNLYRETAMPWEWVPRLKALADEIGIVLFGSVFDRESVDFLKNASCYKIASCELVDLPLIYYAAGKGKPMILSTGMATWDEINEAIYACLAAGNDQIVILKCTSGYPAKPEDMNLVSIDAMAETFGCPVGLSDHTLGYTADIMAVAMGACLIEKHIKFNNWTKSPDAQFSLPVYHVDSNDHSIRFSDMVKAIREAEAMIGEGTYPLSPSEADMRQYRRSLYTVARVREGEPFTEANVRSIRPANGLEPKYLGQVLNSRARININYGTPLSWDMIEDKGES